MRMKGKLIQRTKQEYKLAKNEYVRIGRDEEEIYEIDAVDNYIRKINDVL